MANHVEPQFQNVDYIDPCPETFCASRDDYAPMFSTEGFVNGDIQKISLEDYLEKWTILFFYPSDFTFV